MTAGLSIRLVSLTICVQATGSCAVLALGRSCIPESRLVWSLLVVAKLQPSRAALWPKWSQETFLVTVDVLTGDIAAEVLGLAAFGWQR